MNAPLSPTIHEQEERKIRGIARVRRGELRSSFFFNGNGDEAGPFGPYVPICGPFPQAVRFDVVFFKAVFTKRASIPPFFRPQKWLRRSNMAVPAFPLSLSFPLPRVFPLFFFHRGERALRIQWRLSISDESFVAACGWTFILFDRRASAFRPARGTYRPYNRLM